MPQICSRSFTAALGLGLSLAAAPVFASVLARVLAPGAAVAQDTRTLGIVAQWELKNLDPSVNGHAFTRMEVAETFVDAQTDGTPKPGLATAWTVSPDGLVWRLRIRSGVKFHDGTVMTAGDVANALSIARAKPGSLSKAPIRSIAAEGDEVTILLDTPFSPLPSILADNATQILAPASYNEKGEVVRLIGTGPYRLIDFKPPQQMTVARFADYWGEPASIEKATYLATHRSETRTVMAESGDAQIVINLDPPSLQRLARNPKLTIHAAAIPRVIALKVNAGHPFLNDPRARQALSLGIDRAGIAAGILRRPETAATQLIPPSLGAWHNRDLAPLKTDIDQAKALLAQLGWKPGADGTLQRDGQRFHLTLRTYPDRPELPPVAAALADQFRAIGVETTIALGNFSEIPSGHQNGTLEIGLIARSLATAPDPLGTLLQDFSPKGGDWGAMNWSNGALDAALQAVLRSADGEAARKARQEVTGILQSELPLIPVVWYVHSAAVSKQVAGFAIDPFERSYLISRMRWVQ